MMLAASLIHALLPSDRRCFDRKEAASYFGVSVGTFDRLVQKGELPQPLLLLGRKVWDRHLLDRSLNKMSGLKPNDIVGQEPETALDTWRRTNAND